MKIESVLSYMSINDKANFLNLLRKIKYPGTPLAGQMKISNISKEYFKDEVRGLIDSIMWEYYGLHYRSYISMTPGKGISGSYIDPEKVENKINSHIIYYLENL